MALNEDYQKVYDLGISTGSYEVDRGTHSVHEIIKELGLEYKYENGESVGDFITTHKSYPIEPAFYRNMAWGRRAILSVPSLNIENGVHAVYYDGHEIFDPSPKLTYTKFSDLKPSHIVLFREPRREDN